MDLPIGNDPKHTAKSFKQSLLNRKVNVLLLILDKKIHNFYGSDNLS